MVSVPVPDTLSGMASDRLSSGVHWNTTRVSSCEMIISSGAVRLIVTP